MAKGRTELEPQGKEWWEIEEERFTRIEEEYEDEGLQRLLRGVSSEEWQEMRD